jgi:Trk K+ transport system NAD-binding subunit
LKFLFSQMSYLLGEQETRRNLGGLLKYLAFLAVVITAFAAVFHELMALEGRTYSWTTAFYWTLTVMSTLGFGDITFESDLGRAFSLFVLMSGIILLLIVLPFAFIRFFYAPWLEAQIHSRAPRSVSKELSEHVIICSWDTIAKGLAQRFKLLGIPYCVIEPDPARAAQLHGERVPVVTGELDAASTYRAAGVSRARAVLANLDDATNTNITLTIREVSSDIEVIATAEHGESIDLIELAGATQVLPLKQQLGEQLAARANAQHCEAHVIGRFRDLLIAEFPVHRTPLAGCTIRDTQLRQVTGVSVVGVWERGRLLPARPDTGLSPYSVPVVVGTQDQINELNGLIEIFDLNPYPILVLGGGKVGRSSARALKQRGVAVHLVEHLPDVAAKSEGLVDQVFVGEAADRDLLLKAGLEKAPTVILTTNDDATNIYLCIYCRRLNPELRIVSRITHERNIEAIHRAGADFVLSYASLGQESIVSRVQNRELIFVGEGVRFYSFKTPRSLDGVQLKASEIGARTGLNVIGIKRGDKVVTNPRPDTVLSHEGELLALGTPEQRKLFHSHFG